MKIQVTSFDDVHNLMSNTTTSRKDRVFKVHTLFDKDQAKNPRKKTSERDKNQIDRLKPAALRYSQPNMMAAMLN